MIDCHDLDLIWEFIFLSRKWQFMTIDWALKDNSTRVSTLKSMRLSQVILWVRYVDSLIYEHVGSKRVTFVLRCFWRVKWREKGSTQEGRCASKRANMKTGQRDWCATRVRRTSKYCDGGQRRHRHSCNQLMGRDTPNEKRWNLKYFLSVKRSWIFAGIVGNPGQIPKNLWKSNRIKVFRGVGSCVGTIWRRQGFPFTYFDIFCRDLTESVKNLRWIFKSLPTKRGR